MKSQNHLQIGHTTRVVCCLSLLWFALFLSPKALAINESAQTFTLDGQLFHTGTTKVILDSNIKLTVQIINPAGTCLLYEEEQYVSTATSNGHFTIYVGSATGATKRTVNDPGRTMAQVFQNSVPIMANNVAGQTCAASLYTPVAGAVRYFRIIVTPSQTNIANTLTPDLVIDSVPSAIVAQSLQGVERSQILQMNNSGSTVLTQSNLEALFTTPAYSNLQSILAGNFMQIDSSGATLPSYAANPAGVANGDIWFDTVTNEIKYKNAAGIQTVGAAGSGITSLTVGSSMSVNGTVAGTISGSGTIDLSNTGVTAGTYTKMTVDEKGRVTAGTVSLVEADIPNLTSAGKVSGNTIISGTISGSAGVNTSGNLITTATVSGLTVQATNLRVYNGSNYIQMNAPALGGNVNLTLPATDGNSGEFLRTDGSGALTWASPVSVDVTAALGFMPLGPSTLFAGDISGTYSAISVEKLQGKAITAGSVSGQMMIYNGTAWTNNVMSGDATLAHDGMLTLNKVPVSKGGTNTTTFGNNKIISSNGTGSTLQDFSCPLNQVITFDASGYAVCANVSTLSGGILNGGNTTAADISIGTNDNFALKFKTNNSIAMTISQNGFVGIGTTAPSTALDVSGAINYNGIAAPAVSSASEGRIYYDRTANKFKVSQNGAAYTDLVVSGGVTSLGGQTGATQTLSISVDNSVALPTIASASDAHTWKIPMASNAGTTAGLLNKTDYDLFSAKLATTTSFAGDVSGTYNATIVQKIQGKDVTAASVSGQMMIYNGTAWTNSVMSGDATMADTGVMTLATTGVGAGTYSKVTVDTKGRVTAAAQITSSDVTAALGYTPVDRAGDTMTGALNMGGQNLTNVGNLELAASKHLLLGQYAADPATGTWGATEKGRTWFNTTSNEIRYWDGSSVKVLGVAGSGLTSLGGQTGSTQTLSISVDNSVATPTLTSATNAHTWKIPMASNAGTTAGLLNKTDYDLFSAKLGTTTSFAGDVSSTYNATVVQKIQGKDITAASVSGQMMIYNGTAWTNNVMSGDATLAHDGMFTLNKVPVSKGGTNAITFGNNKIISSNGTGTALQDFSCSLNQVISFDASGNAVCADVSSLSGAILNGGNTTAANISIGTNDNKALHFKTNNTIAMTISQGGRVGIGTQSPTVALEVVTDYTAGRFEATQVGANVPAEFIASGGGAGFTNIPYINLHNKYGTSNSGMGLIFTGRDSNPQVVTVAGIEGRMITNTVGNHSGILAFGTTNGGSALTERMRISEAGNVGIGLTNPSAALDVSGAFNLNGIAAPTVAPANEGRIYFDRTANKFKVSQNGAAYTDLLSSGGITSFGGQSGATQTLAISVDNSVALPTITSASDAHTWKIPMASNAGTTAGLLNKTDYDLFSAKLGTTTSFAGDVSGTYNATVVQKIQGKDVTAASVSGQMMIYNGTAWTNNVMSGDATLAHDGMFTLNKVPVSKGGTNAVTFGNNRIIASNGTGTALQDFTCSLNQVITFDASGNAVCANVTSLSAGILNGGNTTGADISIGTNDNYALNFKVNNSVAMTISQSGFVGIGNTNPGTALSISGGGFYSPVRISTTTDNLVDVISTSATGRVGLGLSGRAGSNPWFIHTGASDTGLYFKAGNNINSSPDRFVIKGTGEVGIGTTAPSTALDVSGAINYIGIAAPSVSPASEGRIYFDRTANKFKVSENGGLFSNLVSVGTGTTNALPKFTGAGTLGDSAISDNGTVITATRAVISTTNAIASGAAVNLATSNTHTLASVGGSAISISGQQDGGMYTVVVEDTTSRTYTFTGCTNSYFKPTNGPTTAASRTVYGLMTIKKGANWDCYVTWSSGFQ